MMSKKQAKNPTVRTDWTHATQKESRRLDVLSSMGIRTMMVIISYRTVVMQANAQLPRRALRAVSRIF